MSRSSNDAARDASTHSNAFLSAVTQLGRRQAVVTSKAIYNQQGIKLLEGGVQIGADLYERLVTHRLAAPLDESMSSARQVTGGILREAAEAALARWPFFALMGPAGRVRGMLLQAIEAIPLPQPVAFHLTLVRETRPALFDHSVLVALLATHLVREGGAPIHDMTVAASAGLLHDLGMLHIDAELLEAGNRLNGDERRPLYVHPMTSSMLIARFHEYPKQVARAILEHHELLDGSGYPRGLAGEAISPLGRLLALCEVVCAMFDGEREHPEQRVSVLLRASPRRFDAALVPSIHRLLRAVPATRSEVALTLADAVAHLQALAQLLAKWHAAVAEAAGALDAAGMAVLEPITEQAETLQHVLFEAGIAPEQLDMLAGSAQDDASLRAELWVLTRELPWHLRATANQLQLRWRTACAGRTLPPALTAWVTEVEAIAAGA